MFARILLVFVALAAPQAVLAQKTFKWSSSGDITTQDPHAQDESFTKSFNAMVYERLIMPGKDMNATAWLATSWKVISPTTRVLTLRKDVKFTDGTPMTADDVVFSFERAAKSQQFRTYAIPAGKPRKIDAYTVEFTTDKPNPVGLIAIGEIPIMSKAWSEKNNSAEPQNYAAKEVTHASRNAMGTGPFKLVTYETGVKTVLEKNKDWWGIKDGRMEGNIDVIEYRPIGNAATRLAALKSGELDFVLDPPVQDVFALKTDPAFKVWEGDETRVITFTFDQARDELLFSDVKGKNPFKDRRVRQALYQAIDVNAIRTQIMRGLSTPTAIATPNPKGEGIPASYEKRLPYDVEAAKKLLAEAGYPKGFGFTLHCPNDRYVNDDKICLAAAAMWAKIGLDVKVDAMPKAQYFQRTPKKEFSACMQGWGDNNRDAIFTFKPLFHSLNDKGYGDTNYGNFSNAELDALIDAIDVEMDPAKRQQQINKAIEVLQREVLVIPIHRQVIPWVSRSNISLVHRSDNKFAPIWVKIN
ncbi:ABC transporter substrate-binding protein [Usitatibacter palustris]|uniref:Heme-binding protein A n=1 Tax=Usitatibacter palustris TaxID=2732487 RepID=A0A6M4H4R7_9PROT|nr:ABC transporter substrate-binding protein [Usitatibacter palustris]QJR14639.1 Heme-binding protein A [Usitatibacter palustris]